MQGRREPVRTGKDNDKGMPIYRLGSQAGAWSGKDDPPKIGDPVDIAFNGLGTGRVTSYAVVHDYLAMRVVFDDPPDWYVKQNGAAHAGHVFGAELQLTRNNAKRSPPGIASSNSSASCTVIASCR